MLSKKHFEMLARGLSNNKPRNPAVPPREHKAALKHRTLQWKADVCAIADMLATTNPRFDRERFLKACGYESWVYVTALAIDQGEAR